MRGGGGGDRMIRRPAVRNNTTNPCASTPKSKIVWDRLLDFPLTAPIILENCWTRVASSLELLGQTARFQPIGIIGAGWEEMPRGLPHQINESAENSG